MSRRVRIKPFDRGTAEHVLFDRHRRSVTRANALQCEATTFQTEADAERAKADHYAKALAALGHPQQPLRLEPPKG